MQVKDKAAGKSRGKELLGFGTFDDLLPKRNKINIFLIGDLWCFKYFFERGIFRILSKYYNHERYRFELKDEAKEKVMGYLEKNGFEPVLIEDFSDYVVKIERYKKYAPILKNSVDYVEMGKDRFFIMKDLASLGEAIEKGAEKYSMDTL